VDRNPILLHVHRTRDEAETQRIMERANRD
jgi:hypothetical protein